MDKSAIKYTPSLRYRTWDNAWFDRRPAQVTHTCRLGDRTPDIRKVYGAAGRQAAPIFPGAAWLDTHVSLPRLSYGALSLLGSLINDLGHHVLTHVVRQVYVHTAACLTVVDDPNAATSKLIKR